MQGAKTPAQRQASRKARLQAAGLVRWSRWVHADDAAELARLAAELQRKRTESK